MVFEQPSIVDIVEESAWDTLLLAKLEFWVVIGIISLKVVSSLRLSRYKSSYPSRSLKEVDSFGLLSSSSLRGRKENMRDLRTALWGKFQ